MRGAVGHRGNDGPLGEPSIVVFAWTDLSEYAMPLAETERKFAYDPPPPPQPETNLANATGRPHV